MAGENHTVPLLVHHPEELLQFGNPFKQLFLIVRHQVDSSDQLQQRAFRMRPDPAVDLPGRRKQALQLRFRVRQPVRLLSVVMSTWLGAVGILVYEQGFGFIQLYNAPFYMALPAVSAILIGGASVNKASIANVIIGTFLFQGIVTMTPTVMNNMIHMDMSEVIRVVASQGMILYALTRKTEATK